ncbi:hypothetical protein [Streptomyces sp. NPDC047981]|uniref:hypothetical protein n=1 Tax=Streptomyces sp. NPDC047981 TaxID=3154610 RepID=UPI003423377A
MSLISTTAARLAAAVDGRRRDGVTLVAVDGMGGSGKSSLAAALAESYGAAVVHGDDHGPIDWESRWRLAEEHYLAATRPRERADVVVPGH